MSSSSTTTAPVTPERILQMAWGYAPPLVIESAVRLKLFDTLHLEAKTAEEVASQTGTHPRGVRAILDCLVGLGFVAVDSARKYSLTPESRTFLVSGEPGFLGGFFKHTSSQILPVWLQLSKIVQTGKPAITVNQEGDGSTFFEEFVVDIFPMSYMATQVLGDNLALAKTQRPTKVLDLAAGSGVWGIGLAQKSPHISVTAVDWAKVIPTTRKMATRFGMADRFNFIEGDLLEVDFGKGFDVATLGHILHSEGAERSQKLLQKTFDALAPGGTIAIAEFLTNDERTGPPQALIFAVNMLVNTDQGDTFSFQEIQKWLGACGFQNARLLEAPGPSPLILATKPQS